MHDCVHVDTRGRAALVETVHAPSLPIMPRIFIPHPNFAASFRQRRKELVEFLYHIKLLYFNRLYFYASL